MSNAGNIAHTVGFFQDAFTIILALSLGEALKAFASDNPDHPLFWNRLPALLTFLLVFFPFFQSMSQYFYITYLNPRTALKFNPDFLVFDGVMYTLEAGCFFMMSRALVPHRWRRLYITVLILMLIDIGWAGLTYLRGVHVGGWLYIDAIVVAAILAMLWFEHGKPHSMRPSYVGLAVIATTTALSYWIERNMYFP
jgi:hypothetical protein